MTPLNFKFRSGTVGEGGRAFRPYSSFLRLSYPAANAGPLHLSVANLIYRLIDFHSKIPFIAPVHFDSITGESHDDNPIERFSSKWRSYLIPSLRSVVVILSIADVGRT